MVADEGQDEVVLQSKRAARSIHYHVVHYDFFHAAAEVSLNFPCLDAVFYIGLDPILHVMVQLRLTVNQGDASTMAPEIKSCDGGRILATDDQHLAVVVRVRLAVIVRDPGAVLARNAKLVGKIVVSGGDDDRASAIAVWTAGAIRGCDAEAAILPHDGLDPLILADVELIMLGDFAVVLKSFFASGFLMGSRERNLADFEQFGSRKK